MYNRRRRVAGVVERGGLENRCAFRGTEGSNPSLSASFSSISEMFPAGFGRCPWGLRFGRFSGVGFRLPEPETIALTVLSVFFVQYFSGLKIRFRFAQLRCCGEPWNASKHCTFQWQIRNGCQILLEFSLFSLLSTNSHRDEFAPGFLHREYLRKTFFGNG
jgi:hypothetical protein